MLGLGGRGRSSAEEAAAEEARADLASESESVSVGVDEFVEVGAAYRRSRCRSG